MVRIDQPSKGQPPVLTVISLNGLIEGEIETSGNQESTIEVLTTPQRYSSHLGRDSQGDGLEYEPERIGSQINVAISLASGSWILVLFGDEGLQPGWLGQFSGWLLPDGACREVDVVVCRSTVERCLPLLAVRRQAFVYGALDAGFECERLVLWHWLHLVYDARRTNLLPTSGALEKGCDWLSMRLAPQPMAGAANALARFGEAIDPDVYLALLDSALAAPDRTIAELGEMHRQATRRASRQKKESPYLVGEYRPRSFWEENTRGYVKWEAYQPDEAEIVEVASRLQPSSVLELGCGVGRNARYFKAAGRYSGIDISGNLLARSGARREGNWLGNVCGTITRLPFADGSWELVFGDSTVQHVVPAEITACVAEILRVSARYVCLIEYTAEEAVGGSWFSQVHMFPHDYRALFAPYCKLLWHTETSLRVHPARKEVFLFEKR